MTRTLLIHCGMPKAGSSTLQDEMRVLARENPRYFSFRHLYPDTCDQLASRDKKTLLTFRNLFAHCQKNDKSCMMSQEVLSQKSNALKVLVELASGYFDRTEVFFLIRDPAASILSAYQQWGFRDSRISRSINKLIKESGDEAPSILLSCKEWFTLLSLRRAIDNQFISYMIFLNPAELMDSFAEELSGLESRLSALSFDDSPRDQSLLRSCVNRLGLQDTFDQYLPKKPTVANRSFNPFAVEVIVRDRNTGLFRDPSPISPHDNALVRKFSEVLDNELGTTLVFADGLSAELSDMYVAAVQPLKDDLAEDVVRGDWTRFNRPPTVSELPTWETIQKVYREALKSRSDQVGSRHKLQLERAAEIYKGLSPSYFQMMKWTVMSN